MPAEKSHDALVRKQFSPQARSYLTSAVHAAGQDLEEMVRRVGPRPEAVALDLGCGGGHVTFRLAQIVGKVVACDLSEAMLGVVADEAARRGFGNVVTERGAAERLPFAEGAFDLVVTRYSAHHWADPAAGLREMRRVVRSGGQGIFVDVVAPASALFDTWLHGLELLRDPSHVRNYSLGEWRTMVGNAGFRMVETMEYRLRLEFAAWVARMRTPEVHVAAIRSLQQQADADVAKYFAFEDDGSFTIDTALVICDAT